MCSLLAGLVLLLGSKDSQNAGGLPPAREFPFSASQPLGDGSGKRVFANIVYTFRPVINLKPPEEDYYAKQFLRPEGENNRMLAEGGFIRDRPIPVPLPPDGADLFDYNAKREIQLAVKAGIDGFQYDLWADSGKPYDYMMSFLKVAPKVDPNFKILLMPDMSAYFKKHPEALEPLLEKIASEPALFHDDQGRVVLSPFDADLVPVSYWSDLISNLGKKGIKISLIPIVQHWKTSGPLYRSVSDGLAIWTQSPGPDTASQIHQMGYPLFAAPVMPQYERPNAALIFESDASAQFRNDWETAMKPGNDWVFALTWNDYSEGTEIAPSVKTGYAWYDLTAYYTAKFKNGVAPTITEDAAYLFQRAQSVNASFFPKQTRIMKFRGKPGEDVADVVVLLKRPATVVLSGGYSKSYRLPAGLSAVSFPLPSSPITVTVTRAGKQEFQGTSHIQGDANPEVQDLLYHAERL